MSELRLTILKIYKYSIRIMIIFLFLVVRFVAIIINLIIKYLIQMQRQLPYSVTIQVSPPSLNEKQYIDIIGKVLAVDKEIDEKNVDKSIVISEKGLTIKISANQLKLLRACVTGIFKHTRLVAETIKEFKDIQ